MRAPLTCLCFYAIYGLRDETHKKWISSLENHLNYIIILEFTQNRRNTQKGDKKAFEEVFETSMAAKKSRPTNSEFIALVADKLILENMG